MEFSLVLVLSGELNGSAALPRGKEPRSGYSLSTRPNASQSRTGRYGLQNSQ
jgi:hypothetical protein